MKCDFKFNSPCIEWNVRVFNIWLLMVCFFLPSLYFYFEIFLFQLWFINELWSSLSVFIEDFLWIFYYLMWILYIKICISVDFWQFSVGHPDSRSFFVLIPARITISQIKHNLFTISHSYIFDRHSINIKMAELDPIAYKFTLKKPNFKHQFQIKPILKIFIKIIFLFLRTYVFISKNQYSIISTFHCSLTFRPKLSLYFEK